MNIPFTCRTPDIDETPQAGETPRQLVLRLAETKAARIAESESDAIIIGSDQLAVLGDNILGKPGKHEDACRQLRAMSGQCVQFLTALCLLNSSNGNRQLACIRDSVYFRELTDQQIDRYLKTEQPYQCAGSFKSEALGITLVEKIDSEDPTALIGLPLISLTKMLQNESYIIP